MMIWLKFRFHPKRENIYSYYVYAIASNRFITKTTQQNNFRESNVIAVLKQIPKANAIDRLCTKITVSVFWMPLLSDWITRHTNVYAIVRFFLTLINIIALLYDSYYSHSCCIAPMKMNHSNMFQFKNVWILVWFLAENTIFQETEMKYFFYIMTYNDYPYNTIIEFRSTLSSSYRW